MSDVRYVSTVEEYSQLIDDAATGLIPKARAAFEAGSTQPMSEFVAPQAQMIASVVDFESDDILGFLISMGYEPTTSNEEALPIVTTALSRAVVQGEAELNLRETLAKWRDTAAKGESTPVDLANGGLDVAAALYDFVLKCGASKDGGWSMALRASYWKATLDLSESNPNRDADALTWAGTVAQVIASVTRAGGPFEFALAVVESERGVIGGAAAA